MRRSSLGRVERVDEAAEQRAPAVARAAMVLRLLSAQRSGLGVSEIARRLDLVPSTCLHLLRALVAEGFIAFDDEKKTYRTSAGLFTLARDTMASRDFAKVVQPLLDQFAMSHHVTALAVELDRRDHLIAVAVSRADNFVSIHINMGARFPSLASAAGRCIAAISNESREQLRERFKALTWEKAPSFEDWHREVERARIEGVAVDHGNYIRGISVISALMPPGMDRIVRGITLIGLDHNMTQRAIRQMKDEILSAIHDVAARLH